MLDPVEAVKAHALKHYTDGGWDVVIECWTDEEIRQYLVDTGAKTVPEAISMFQRLADVWADRQADAINSAF